MGATHSFRVNDGIHFLPAVFSPLSRLYVHTLGAATVLYGLSYMRRGHECCLLVNIIVCWVTRVKFWFVVVEVEVVVNKQAG